MILCMSAVRSEIYRRAASMRCALPGIDAPSKNAARWIESDDIAMVKKFNEENRASVAEDHDGSAVFLARNAWHLNKAEEDWPDIKFLRIKDAVA